MHDVYSAKNVSAAFVHGTEPVFYVALRKPKLRGKLGASVHVALMFPILLHNQENQPSLGRVNHLRVDVGVVLQYPYSILNLIQYVNPLGLSDSTLESVG